MPLSVQIVVLYLALEMLATVLATGRRIKITTGSATITVITHGLMIWAVIAAFAHHH